MTPTNARSWHSGILFWPLLLLSGFLSALLLPFPIVGCRWTGEVACGLLLFIVGFVRIWSRRRVFDIGLRELRCFVLPFVLFIVWSGLSITWAESSRAAVHHTLVWCGYLFFYLLVRPQLQNKDEQNRSLTILGIAAFIICSVGLIEYLGSPAISASFTSRYYLFDESLVCLIPLMIAVACESKGPRSISFAVLVCLIWLLTLATRSRTMFLAGIFAGVLFILLVFIRQGWEKIKAPAAIFGLMVIVSLSLLLPLRTNVSTIGRLSGQDADANSSTASRFLMGGLAIEGFRKHPVLGLGADNYFARYDELREGFAERYPDSELNAINEDFLPERAHNEYLQVLSELGIVGIVLFGWMLLGVFRIFFKSELPSLIRIAAFVGCLGFLLSSGFSSYSFRFPTNGLVFFFLVALLIPDELQKVTLSRKGLYLFLVLSICLVGFSSIRGLSVYHLSRSQEFSEPSAARAEIEKGISLDPNDPMLRYYYGQMLMREGRYGDSAQNLRIAIKNGMANSTAYFNLIAALQLDGKTSEVHSVYERAVRIYPKSVFLRTGFSDFLGRNGDERSAAEQFEIANLIDPKAARSWKMAFGDGLEKLTLTSNLDKSYFAVAGLKPLNGPLVLDNFQRLEKETRK